MTRTTACHMRHLPYMLPHTYTIFAALDHRQRQEERLRYLFVWSLARIHMVLWDHTLLSLLVGRSHCLLAAGTAG